MAVDKEITIVGCGPGSIEYLIPAALKSIIAADVLIGSQKLLDLFPDAAGERMALTSNIREVLDDMAELLGRKRMVVLVTGDPGLFSFAKPVIERFGRDRCRLLPGISSVQVAFSRIGLDWADARIISTHKEDPTDTPALADAEKVAVLGGREGSLKWIAHHLLPGECDVRIFVCQNLTLENEELAEVTAGQLAELRVSPQTIVLIIKRSVLE
ncbi:MAG TPA: precorrin-6y C5,15-methyltransferase (decarboxylating) subunit CbiE [Desulfomonilaceae bacterium]|nr:precorrin-6y C5,15-methyltransferase (decarboxylating) subunit CbiE [Desulfomonilaceae bacterium]